MKPPKRERRTRIINGSIEDGTIAYGVKWTLHEKKQLLDGLKRSNMEIICIIRCMISSLCCWFEVIHRCEHYVYRLDFFKGVKYIYFVNTVVGLIIWKVFRETFFQQDK